MKEKDIVNWYRDLQKTSWIFPDNSRTVNLMEEDSDLPDPIQQYTCVDCYVQSVCKKLGTELSMCTDYICKEEVLGE